jgi:hypothetical protein
VNPDALKPTDVGRDVEWRASVIALQARELSGYRSVLQHVAADLDPSDADRYPSAGYATAERSLVAQ